MSVRDFEDSNFSLLSKQCWHIFHSPSSMLAKCLQVKYYSSGNFLGASLVVDPFFMVKSFRRTKSSFLRSAIPSW